MSAQDPLSEALDALRVATKGYVTARDLTICKATLARLDALPAPYRDQIGRLDNVGWFYPDAPMEDS